MEAEITAVMWEATVESAIPRCYKCKGTDDLSRKTEYLVVCKNCRNEKAKLRYRMSNPSPKQMPDEYFQMAKESVDRISRRFK